MSLRLPLTCLMLCALALPAAADQWVRTQAADVRLVSAAAATGTARTVPLGLQFRLEEGWKIYWRTPGDAGYPPRLDSTGSTNLEGLEWHWPVPERFLWNDLENIGYRDTVMLPLTAVLADAGEPLSVKAALDALACNEICIPIEADLRVDVPAGTGTPTAFTQLISRWRARVPGPGDGVGLAVDATARDGGSVVVTLRSDTPLESPDVFIESDRAGYGFRAPRTELSADRRTATVTLEASFPRAAIPATLPVTLTVADGPRFLETTAVIDIESAGGAVWLTMLGIALLGGLILNLMPCVLPVLSLKLMQVLQHSGTPRATLRVGFLWTAAGVLASFLALAAAAVLLKAAGVAVGWGIQFQQPLFLVAMILVLGLFAANLSGLFEIPLPSFLARLGTGGAGHAGHFLSGAFATLLATPCSAPFVGTALGFALSAGSVEILAIFVAMGTGLAAPYLAVALFPGAVRLLPRPGPWMPVMRAILAVALLGTGAWLASILAAQLEGAWRLATILALAASALIFLAWACWRRRALAVASLCLACGALVLAALPPRGDGAGRAEDPVPGPVWQAFDPARIPPLVASGRLVFVDVTADWCLTCKVNAAVVLERRPVSARLADPGVVAMRADWTRPDAGIAHYLASFGRFGIPFNAVYGPGAPNGLTLPELLSPGMVLDGLVRARGLPEPRRTASVTP